MRSDIEIEEVAGGIWGSIEENPYVMNESDLLKPYWPTLTEGW